MMKNYQETIQICKEFYKFNTEFWKRERHSFPESMALTETSKLVHDPFSPCGAKLDRKAVIDFCESEAWNY